MAPGCSTPPPPPPPPVPPPVDLVPPLLWFGRTRDTVLTCTCVCAGFHLALSNCRIDWEAMSQMAIPSPYNVSVKDGADCKNFDKYPEEPVGWVSGKDSHNDIFVGF